MSQGRQMTIALDRRMSRMARAVAGLPVDAQVLAYLKLVRRNEYRDHGWPRAAASRARREIMKRVAPLGVGLYALSNQLTDEERRDIARRREDVERVVFNRWAREQGLPTWPR